MSIEHYYGKKEISINEDKSIIIEEKGEDGYRWETVSFKTGQDLMYVGTYYTYDYLCSKEWIKYNENYIVFLIMHNYGYEWSEPQVGKIFDMSSKQFIEGSKEQLLEFYRENFNSNIKKRVFS